MARSRNIKPGFFKNDTLAEIDPLGRILFSGLWTIADREGRLEDRPKRIKAEVLPYDNCDVDGLLEDLNNKGFILRYEAAGVRYIQITNWDKHQNPHKNEAGSEIPSPYESDNCTIQERDEHSTSIVQAPEKHNTNRADSLNTDSFNPINTSSCGDQINEIVGYLNIKAGSKYKPTTRKTQSLVKARMNEGFTVDDFKQVIDTKVAEWLNNKDMAKYLRPETLFGTKFEGYLNQTNPQLYEPINFEERRRQKEQELFDKKVELQRWVEAGNDPDDFVYQPRSGS